MVATTLYSIACSVCAMAEGTGTVKQIAGRKTDIKGTMTQITGILTGVTAI